MRMRGLKATAACVGAAVMMTTGAASADVVYTDAIGDNFDGNANMDIVSLTMSHDDDFLYATLELAGSIADPNHWGKYLFFFNTVPGGGTIGNPWGRNIETPPPNEIEFFTGSWVDSGGAVQLWAYTGSWSMTSQNAIDLSAAADGKVTYTFSRTELGLIGDGTFFFDVASSGGNAGDTANDSLGTQTQISSGWGDLAILNDFVSYTIPAPASVLLLGLGALIPTRRRRA